MRTGKTIGAIVVGLVLMLACSGVVVADGGAHGPYTELGTTSDGIGCQGCHAPHRGARQNLLRSANAMYDFCISCHGTSGGARTNVQTGVFQTGSASWSIPDEYGADNPATGPAYTKQLNGGRFESGAESTHKVLASDEGITMTTYGSGISDTADTTTTNFLCTSCHDPHGVALSDVASTVLSQTNGNSDNYRLLREYPVYSWEAITTTGNTVTDAVKSYTKLALKNETNEANSGISEFCADCHVDYLSTSAANTITPNAPGAVRWVHRENVAISNVYSNNLGASRYPLPVDNGSGFRGFYQTSVSVPTDADSADYSKWMSGSLADATYNGTNDKIQCLTCHNAHGSVATADDVSTTYNRAGTQSLLRFDERAVCQSCHKKNPTY